MNIVELQDGFNLHVREKVFWLSRKAGWTREQIAQVRTIVDDCILRLESELGESEDQRHDIIKECNRLRDEIWDLRDKLSVGVCD